MKAAAAVAVSSVMGGAGLLYDPEGPSRPWSPYERAYAVEVGVVFEEAAVRDALPAGRHPAPGLTGGIAVYGGGEGLALSPSSTGHVWIDVVEEVGGATARYIVTGFASGSSERASPVPLNIAILGETHELDEHGVLRVLSWPDRASTLNLVVRTQPADCVQGVAARQVNVLTTDPEGRLGSIPVASPLEWCEAEAEALHANVTAPRGHALRPFVPQQVLWGRVATPANEDLSDLPTD